MLLPTVKNATTVAIRVISQAYVGVLKDSTPRCNVTLRIIEAGTASAIQADEPA